MGLRGRIAPAGGGRLGIADFAVPALLAFAQIAGTWLLTTGVDEPVERGRWMAAVAAILVCNAALIPRRIAPAPVLAVTLVFGAAGTLAINELDAVVGGVADGVALFSLAVHRNRRQATLGCIAAYVVMSVAFAPVREGAAALLTNGILDAAAYVAITALGQLRRQRKARRRELGERLEAAERERRDAAEAERERLARDLHDVAGHHLSAVVVHSTAASRIDDPDLTGRALTSAADTGRDVLRALSRMVDVVGPESGDARLDALLPPLCQGLARLGVPVSLSVEGSRRLRPQVTNAVYRIVQEALTNAMRYAQGAAVSVEVRHGSGEVEATVRNAAPPEEIPVPAMGGGRGIAGMRERAETLGGTLTAGPDEQNGGWVVRAVLPTSASGRRGPGWPEVLDGATIGVCVALPSAAPDRGPGRGRPRAARRAVTATAPSATPSTAVPVQVLCHRGGAYRGGGARTTPLGSRTLITMPSPGRSPRWVKSIAYGPSRSRRHRVPTERAPDAPAWQDARRSGAGDSTRTAASPMGTLQPVPIASQTSSSRSRWGVNAPPTSYSITYACRPVTRRPRSPTVIRTSLSTRSVRARAGAPVDELARTSRTAKSRSPRRYGTRRAIPCSPPAAKS